MQKTEEQGVRVNDNSLSLVRSFPKYKIMLLFQSLCAFTWNNLFRMYFFIYFNLWFFVSMSRDNKNDVTNISPTRSTLDVNENRVSRGLF